MGSFALDLAAFAAKAPKRAKQVVDKATIDLLTKIVLRTPVGNPSIWKGYPPRKPPAGYVGGRLRGNWNTGIGSINTTEQRPAKTGAAPVARGRATVRTREPEADIYITNSLPYAIRVENGYSTQAPAGMVRVTVVEFQGFVSKAAKAANR